MFHCLSHLSLIVSFLSLKNASCEAYHRPTSQALETATNRPLWGRTFIGCGESSDASAANWTRKRNTRRTRRDAAGRAGSHKYYFRGRRTGRKGCNGCASSHSTVTPTPTPSAAVEQVVQNEVLSYTTGTIEQAALPALLGVGDQPSHPFSNIAVNLGSRVSAKIENLGKWMYWLWGTALCRTPSRKVCSFHGFQWGCRKSTTVNSRALSYTEKGH